MNPWIFIGYGLGWLIIGLAALFVIVFVIATIKVVIDRAKTKKRKPDGGYEIFSSGD